MNFARCRGLTSGMSTAATYVTDREAELIHLARRGDERAYSELVATASQRLARALLSDARLYRRRRRRATRGAAPCLARAAAVRAAKLAPHVAVQDRDQLLPAAGRPAATTPTLGRSLGCGHTAYPAGRAALRVRVDLALPGRVARHRRRHDRAGGALRAAGEPRARVRGDAPTPASEAARRAAPARRARLLGARSRGAPRHERPVRQQRAPARPPHRGRARSRAEPTSDTAFARRRPPP